MATGGGSSGEGTRSLAASGVWLASAVGRSIILGSLIVSIDDGSAAYDVVETENRARNAFARLYIFSVDSSY